MSVQIYGKTYQGSEYKDIEKMTASLFPGRDILKNSKNKNQKNKKIGEPSILQWLRIRNERAKERVENGLPARKPLYVSPDGEEDDISVLSSESNTTTLSIKDDDVEYLKPLHRELIHLDCYPPWSLTIPRLNDPEEHIEAINELRQFYPFVPNNKKNNQDDMSQDNKSKKSKKSKSSHSNHSIKSKNNSDGGDGGRSVKSSSQLVAAAGISLGGDSTTSGTGVTTSGDGVTSGTGGGSNISKRWSLLKGAAKATGSLVIASGLDTSKHVVGISGGLKPLHLQCNMSWFDIQQALYLREHPKPLLLKKKQGRNSGQASQEEEDDDEEELKMQELLDDEDYCFRPINKTESLLECISDGDPKAFKHLTTLINEPPNDQAVLGCVRRGVADLIPILSHQGGYLYLNGNNGYEYDGISRIRSTLEELEQEAMDQLKTKLLEKQDKKNKKKQQQQNDNQSQSGISSLNSTSDSDSTSSSSSTKTANMSSKSKKNWSVAKSASKLIGSRRRSSSKKRRNSQDNDDNEEEDDFLNDKVNVSNAQSGGFPNLVTNPLLKLKIQSMDAEDFLIALKLIEPPSLTSTSTSTQRNSINSPTTSSPTSSPSLNPISSPNLSSMNPTNKTLSKKATFMKENQGFTELELKALKKFVTLNRLFFPPKYQNYKPKVDEEDEEEEEEVSSSFPPSPSTRDRENHINDVNFHGNNDVNVQNQDDVGKMSPQSSKKDNISQVNKEEDNRMMTDNSHISTTSKSELASQVNHSIASSSSSLPEASIGHFMSSTMMDKRKNNGLNENDASIGSFSLNENMLEENNLPIERNDNDKNNDNDEDNEKEDNDEKDTDGNIDSVRRPSSLSQTSPSSTQLRKQLKEQQQLTSQIVLKNETSSLNHPILLQSPPPSLTLNPNNENPNKAPPSKSIIKKLSSSSSTVSPSIISKKDNDINKGEIHSTDDVSIKSNHSVVSIDDNSSVNSSNDGSYSLYSGLNHNIQVGYGGYHPPTGVTCVKTRRLIYKEKELAKTCGVRYVKYLKPVENMTVDQLIRELVVIHKVSVETEPPQINLLSPTEKRLDAASIAEMNSLGKDPAIPPSAPSVVPMAAKPSTATTMGGGGGGGGMGSANQMSNRDLMRLMKKTLHGRNLFARVYALETLGGYTLLHLATHLGYTGLAMQLLFQEDKVVGYENDTTTTVNSGHGTNNHGTDHPSDDATNQQNFINIKDYQASRGIKSTSSYYSKKTSNKVNKISKHTFDKINKKEIGIFTRDVSTMVRVRRMFDGRDKLGCTPLHHACVSSPHFRQLKLIKALLDRGADVNAQDNRGRTPLFYACRSVDEGAISLLLAYNAKINIRTDPLPWENHIEGNVYNEFILNKDLNKNHKSSINNNSNPTLENSNLNSNLNTQKMSMKNKKVKNVESHRSHVSFDYRSGSGHRRKDVIDFGMIKGSGTGICVNACQFKDRQYVYNLIANGCEEKEVREMHATLISRSFVQELLNGFIRYDPQTKRTLHKTHAIRNNDGAYYLHISNRPPRGKWSDPKLENSHSLSNPPGTASNPPRSNTSKAKEDRAMSSGSIGSAKSSRSKKK